MCGIVGFINRKPGYYNLNFDKAFADLKWANQLRGVHGSGVFTVSKEGKVDIFKVPACYEALASQKKYSEKLFTFDQKTFVVGHDRWKTSGLVDMDHTHPLQVGNISLVHNGSLRIYPKVEGRDMDSYSIANSISKDGIDTTINEIEGSYSLVWYNKEERALHFLRNEDRPMFFIHCPKHEGIFFGSEPFMVLMALHRNSIEWDKVEATTVNTEYVFDLTQGEGRSRALIKKELSIPMESIVSGDTGTVLTGGLMHKKKSAKAGEISKNHLEFLHEKWKTEVYKGELFINSDDSFLQKTKRVFPHSSVTPIIPLLPAPYEPKYNSNNVRQIHEQRRKSKVRPITDLAIKHNWKQGKEICFSLDSYKNIRKSNVVVHEQNYVTGFLPKPFDIDYVVEGQTSISENFLQQNDSLYRGEIVSVYENVTEEKIVLLVKSIEISNFKDPNKMTEWELFPYPLQLNAQPICEPYRQRMIKYKEAGSIGQCSTCNGWYHSQDLVSAGHDTQQCLNCMEKEGLLDEANNTLINDALEAGQSKVIMH